MLSGMIDMPGRGTIRPSRAMLYVAEVQSGVVLVYMVPWNGPMHTANQAFKAPLELWTAAPFASAVIRAEE
jgi:hypothetical protein